jgi:hypothetical protein
MVFNKIIISVRCCYLATGARPGLIYILVKIITNCSGSNYEKQIENVSKVVAL